MPRKYDILWTKSAEQDLEATIDFIARDDIDKAPRILTKLRDAAAALSSTPYRSRVVPELYAQGIPRYRELIVSPSRIIYRIGEGQVHILAMFDSRRNLEDILLERFMR